MLDDLGVGTNLRFLESKFISGSLNVFDERFITLTVEAFILDGSNVFFGLKNVDCPFLLMHCSAF